MGAEKAGVIPPLGHEYFFSKTVKNDKVVAIQVMQDGTQPAHITEHN
jgi:hypothetical protein